MTGINEVFWVIPYLGIFFSQAAIGFFRPSGYLRAWIALMLMAGSFRWIAELTPQHSAILCQAFLLLFAASSIQKGWRRFRFSTSSVLFLLLYALILVRNAFPQFDIDSLTYHLPGIRWILERRGLNPYMQLADGQGVQLRLLGFEEFLLFPGSSMDLALFAGVLGGCFKVFVIATVLSMIPKKLTALKYAAAGFVVIDDHFLFSGQNDSVYFNSTFLALIPLSIYWLGTFLIQPTWPRFLRFLSSLMILCFVKYHGLVMAAALGTVSLIGLRALLKSKKKPTATQGLILVTELLALASLYGIHWIQEGSPFYPSTAGGIFEIPSPFRDLKIYNEYFLGGTYTQAMSHLLRLMIYPGNLVLKATAVLILPTLVGMVSVLTFRIFRTKLDSPRFRFFFVLSGLGLVFTIFWIATAHVIRPDESRYPRYTFTAALLAWIWLSEWLSLGWFASIRSRVLILLRPKILATFAVAGLGALIWTWDSRQFNTLKDARQNWADWRAFWKGSSMAILRPLAKHEEDQILALNQCMSQVGDPQGDQTLYYSLMGTWSAYHCLPHALRGDAMAGGLLKNIPENFPKWIVVPKKWMDAGEIPPIHLTTTLNAHWIASGLQNKNRVCETAYYWVAKNPTYAN